VPGVISGVGFNLTKAGTGTVRLNGANTFTGVLEVSNGSLQIGNYDGLDTVSSITVSGGGTAELSLVQVGTGTTTNSIDRNLSLHGILRTAGGSGTNRLEQTWTGNITLAGNSTILNNANSLFDIDGDIDLGAHTLTYQADAAGSRIDGNIIGIGGSFAKTNLQNLTLTGTNTYTGTTTISAGTLVTALPKSLAGYTVSGKVIFDGGRLDITTGDGTTTGWTAAQVATLLSNATKTSGTIGITVANGDVTETAFDFGGLSLIKSGTNTLILNQAHTIGATTITNGGGTLQITDAAALGAGDVRIQTASTNTGTLELALTGTNTITNTFLGFSSANALGSGVAQILNTSGTNTINSSLTVTGTGGNGLNVASNGGLLTLSGTITHTITTSGRNLSLGGSGNGVVSGAINDNTTNSQVLAVNKSGAGTWILTNAANGYTGATSVNGGTLEVALGASTAGSAVTVSNSGSALVVNGTVNGTLLANASTTISGTGTVNGAATINGLHSPGNSPGIQTFTNGLNYGGTATLNAEFVGNALALRGTDFDGVNVTGGNLTVDSLATFALFTSGIDYADPLWDSARDFTVIDFSGAGTSTGSFVLDTANAGSFASEGSWSLANTNNDIMLSWAPIPEPSVTALIGTLGGILLLRRRR
jgi:autotransporter-associated beta strand protein